MHDSVYIWNNIEWIKALQMNCSALFSQVIEMLESIYLYSSVVWLGLINLLGILDLMLDLLFNGKLRFSEWKAETPWLYISNHLSTRKDSQFTKRSVLLTPKYPGWETSMKGKERKIKSWQIPIDALPFHDSCYFEINSSTN